MSVVGSILRKAICLSSTSPVMVEELVVATPVDGRTSSKRLAFSAKNFIVLVPTRSELKPMEEDLYWSAKDVRKFRCEYYSQVHVIMDHRKLSIVDARNLLNHKSFDEDEILQSGCSAKIAT